ncbi:hypothetical protein D9M71_744580 [compost metagenome]
MDLDEVATPVDFGTQGAAAFQFAIDLALQALDLDEGVLAGPEGLEGFVQLQLHGRSCRITSAACCGMEYRSALSA